MAIAFDAISLSGAGGETGNISKLHTPVSTPRALVIGIVQLEGVTDEVTAVEYGGATVNRRADGTVFGANGTELGSVYLYFLGSGIPTGAQTASITVNGTGSLKTAFILTLTATTDTEVNVAGTLDSAGVANPSITLVTTAAETFIVGFLHSGQNSTTGVAPSADYTGNTAWEDDFGTAVSSFIYKTVNGAGGSIPVAWTATSEEAHASAAAISELTGIALTTSATDLIAHTQLFDRQADAYRIINEPFGFNEVIVFASTFASLVLSEFFGVADSAQRSVDWSQAWSESVSYDELFERHADAFRSILESFGVEDSSRATNSLLIVVSEFIGLVEILDRQADAFREYSESVGQSDTFSRQADSFREFSDSFGVVDMYGRAFLIVVADILGIADSGLAALDNVRLAVLYAIMASDSVAYSDSLVDRILTAMRAINDAIGYSDSFATSMTSKRSLTDSIEMLDDVSRMVEARRAFNESVGQADLFSRQANASRIINESLAYADIMGRQSNSQRTFEDSVGVSDSVRRIVQNLRDFTDAIGITDTAAFAARFKLAITEALGLSTSASFETVFRRAVSEFVGLADSVQRNADASRSVSDVIGASDTVQRIVVSLRSFSDDLGLSDSLASYTNVKRAVLDAIGASDSAAWQADYNRSIAESFGVDDEVQRLADALRSITESLGVSDSTLFILREAAVIIWDALASPLVWTAKQTVGDYTMNVTATEWPAKQPGETRTANFEFAAKLGTGETLSSAPTITASPAGLTISGVGISGTKVEFAVAGGTDGQDYHLQATVVTSLGQPMQCDGWLNVRGE